MKLNFKNIGNTNKRLKIVPTNGATITKVNVTNPTFGLDTNNVATFCLAPKLEISCYGATLNVFIAAKHLESETDIPDTTMATVEVYDRGTVEIDFDSSITDINNELAKVGLFAYAIPGGLLEVVNDLQTAARVIVTAINGASMKIDIDNPNPTANFINDHSIYFCLAGTGGSEYGSGYQGSQPAEKVTTRYLVVNNDEAHNGTVHDLDLEVTVGGETFSGKFVFYYMGNGEKSEGDTIYNDLLNVGISLIAVCYIEGTMNGGVDFSTAIGLEFNNKTNQDVTIKVKPQLQDVIIGIQDSTPSRYSAFENGTYTFVLEGIQ